MDHHPHDEESVEALVESGLMTLKENGIRITPQRRAVLEYMIRSTSHPTVEQIYKDLLSEYPGMSLATVYNNLDVLCNYGLVYEMKFTGITSRYDYMGEKHYHILCVECNKIADFNFTDLSDLRKAVKDQTGYDIFHLKLEGYGRCPNCREKVRNKK